MDAKELKSVELFSALKKNELQFVAQHSDEVDEIAHRPRFLPCRRLSLGHPRAGGTRIGRRSR